MPPTNHASSPTSLAKRRRPRLAPRTPTAMHIRPALSCAIALTACFAAATHAAAPAPKPEALRASYQRCLADSGGVTPAMQDCLDAEYAYQDGRLNRVYRRLIQRLSKPEAARLRERQRAWIGQRDHACDPGARPGQGQLFDADNCRLRKTAERAAQLQAQLASTR
ncbi:lysozyme inhibitor LprI family protein [Lysobacter enzymogenes]|uniref:lysozyme inhibitor LprI family protein n=1 Tax=Lysobacter enzymogenes TaxID=69 RepID=UPI0020291637|nr:lysozyme inhibitor LprI family protein [Lysobacter enzymogenes]